jgi:hypothetical protein
MDLCRCDVQKGERRGRASRGVGGVSGGLARCGMAGWGFTTCGRGVSRRAGVGSRRGRSTLCP